MNADITPENTAPLDDPCQVSVATFDRRAEQYEQKYMDVRLYQNGLNILLKKLDNEKAKVLELGCGPGNVTRYLLDRAPNLEITALDLAPGMVRLAQINNPKARCKVMDCRDIHRLVQQFEAIVCGFVLPYLSRQEVARLFGHCAKILNPGGFLYLSAMEDGYGRSGMQQSQTSGDRIFIYYHQAGHITNTLQANGFTIDELHRVQADAAADTDLVVVARKPF